MKLTITNHASLNATDVHRPICARYDGQNKWQLTFKTKKEVDYFKTKLPYHCDYRKAWIYNEQTKAWDKLTWQLNIKLVNCNIFIDSRTETKTKQKTNHASNTNTMDTAGT